MKQLKKSASKVRNELSVLLKAYICGVLKYTEEHYAQMVYDEGLRYLEQYLPDDEGGRDMLSRSRVFWNWWKNHWTTRDESFRQLASMHEVKRVEILRQLYAQYHDAEALAKNLHPNSVVMEESYTDMISELLRSEQHLKI